MRTDEYTLRSTYSVDRVRGKQVISTSGTYITEQVHTPVAHASFQTIVEQRGITKDKKPTAPTPTGIDATTVQSKIVLLTLSFPRLRIIWSSSTQATVDIIADLKINHPEPDLLKAITIGGDDEGEVGAGAAGGESSGLYNTASQEMLRAMPGVTSRNWKLVMSRVDSIRDLCDVESEDAMKEIIGGQEQGKACWTFINKDAR